jgi:hypothetical protein
VPAVACRGVSTARKRLHDIRMSLVATQMMRSVATVKKGIQLVYRATKHRSKVQTLCRTTVTTHPCRATRPLVLTSVRTVFVGVLTLTGIFKVAFIVLVAVAAHQALHALQLLCGVCKGAGCITLCMWKRSSIETHVHKSSHTLRTDEPRWVHISARTKSGTID